MCEERGDLEFIEEFCGGNIEHVATVAAVRCNEAMDRGFSGGETEGGAEEKEGFFHRCA